jgi:hypothetical protein
VASNGIGPNQSDPANGFTMDNIVVIPEPATATATLLAAGLPALGALRPHRPLVVGRQSLS